MDLNIDIVGIICKYIGKKEILNLAKVGKDYYGYIMNEKSIMEKYALKAKERIKNLNFIPKLSFRIFNIDIENSDVNDEDLKYLEDNLGIKFKFFFLSLYIHNNPSLLLLSLISLFFLYIYILYPLYLYLNPYLLSLYTN